MTGFTKIATEKTLKAWLASGAVDKSIGEGLTFVAKDAAAAQGKASWILRYRFAGKHREKVLGRFPEVSLKEARVLARDDRKLVGLGTDVAAAKRDEKLHIVGALTVEELGSLWFDRHIQNKYKNPEPVRRVLRKHINPVIGKVAIRDAKPQHVDAVLTRIVAAGAPTVANDALRYLMRMFHFAAKRQLVETNPAANFDLSDAGGTERSRRRWLKREELEELASAMRSVESFGRINELAVWLLLALCVRKMELLSAQWKEFDLDGGVWRLMPSRTKTDAAIEIPLAPQVVVWLREVKVFACGSTYLFPARRRIHLKLGVPRKNRFGHVSPDTLNVALKRLSFDDMESFTVHDMRRTARTQLAALGIDRFVAERALNHKLKDVEGTYNLHDYFQERKGALAKWALLLKELADGR